MSCGPAATTGEPGHQHDTETETHRPAASYFEGSTYRYSISTGERLRRSDIVADALCVLPTTNLRSLFSQVKTLIESCEWRPLRKYRVTEPLPIVFALLKTSTVPWGDAQSITPMAESSPPPPSVVGLYELTAGRGDRS